MFYLSTAHAHDRISCYRKEAYIRKLSPGSRQKLASILRKLANVLEINEEGSYVHT